MEPMLTARPNERAESSTQVRARFLKRQQDWAIEAGIRFDGRGYLASVTDNLRAPLSSSARKAFEEADGAELRPSRNRPAKMCALHSSSALTVNFFDYWTGRDAAPLLRAMGRHATGALRFEAKFPHGLRGKAPNLDIVFGSAPDLVTAVESKFGEWLSRKRPEVLPFKAKYFPAGASLWKRNGLAACQLLANDIQDDGSKRFRWLDAPQLLKHALGLATQLRDNFSLSYLYYDWPCPWRDEHLEEIQRFSRLVGSELRFAALSYQDLFRRLHKIGGVDTNYLDYLGSRYFPIPNERET
jgi:hypothetical protein